MTVDNVAAAAERLRRAEASRVACDPVRDLIAAGDVATAYAVQAANTRLATGAGRSIAGRKIGLTSPAVQLQLGVDQPDSGVLFADREVPDGGVVGWATLLQPKVEAEVVFVLGADLPDRPVGAADVIRATEFVAAGLEIVDSRIAGWDISIVDTVADNASSGMYVLAPFPVSLRHRDLKDVTMRLLADGEEVSGGSGAACLGHPVNAVVWLANTAWQLGEPLRAGEVVLSGALGPMVTARGGVRYEAHVDGLGRVGVEFEQGD